MLELISLLGFIAAPVIVFSAGVRWGRLASALALVLCLASIFVVRQLAITDSIPHVIRGGVGFSAAFGALAALGPLTSKRWALLVSGGAIAAFILSGLPLFYACGVIGACTSYP